MLTTTTDTNQKIVNTAWHCLKAQNLPTKHGWCLKTTRLIIERALGLGNGGFYRTYLEGHAKATPIVPRDWWARDAHKILRDDHKFGVAFEDRQAGDLIFNYAVAPSKLHPGHFMGHVALLIDRDTVLENGGKGRGVQQFGAIHLTKLGDFIDVHQVIRLQPLAGEARVF